MINERLSHLSLRILSLCFPYLECQKARCSLIYSQLRDQVNNCSFKILQLRCGLASTHSQIEAAVPTRG